jgi:predicted Holliday junction resolvase-like endonuclease
VVVAGVIAVLIGLAIGVVLCWRFLRDRPRIWAEEMLTRWRDEATAKIRAESVLRSEAVLRGRISEQLAPLAPDFPFAPTDVRFIGTPVDFIVFDGYSEVRAGRRESLRSIVFVDVKTGRASLTTIQRRIRNCLEAGGVSCHTLTSHIEVAGG